MQEQSPLIKQNQTIRWKQRFQNYCKALKTLSAAVELSKSRPLTDLEKQGLIQAFEFTQELSWKTLTDYIKFKGIAQDLAGSKDAVRYAYNSNLIENADIWMDMIASRNSSSHTYDQETADDIADKVKNLYLDEFCKLQKRLEKEL